MLNWLVAGAGRPVAEWFDAPPEPAQIDAAWRALADTGGGSIALEPMPLIEHARRAAPGPRTTANSPCAAPCVICARRGGSRASAP
ncbi:MAG: hypothetical protein WDN30_15710 [Pararobbsia sp.]